MYKITLKMLTNFNDNFNSSFKYNNVFTYYNLFFNNHICKVYAAQ